MASIEFSSETLPLKDICVLLGKSATPDSHSIGDIKFKRQGPRRHSELRFFSDAPENATLLEHFLSARDKLGQYDKQNVEDRDIRSEISVAVFYETPFSTFDIPIEIVTWATENDFVIELSSYGRWEPADKNLG